MLIALVYVSVACLYAWICRHAIADLLSSDKDMHHIPDAGFVTRQRLHHVKQEAWIVTCRWFIVFLITAGYIHAYTTEYDMRVAHTEAAKHQGDIYHCHGDTQWTELSLNQKIHFLVVTIYSL